VIGKTITFFFKKRKIMKNILYISIIALCIVALSRNLIAGYESTMREDSAARSEHVDEAYLTSRKEERARMESVNDAFLTENQEEIERMNPDNDARYTSAEERAERS
jgi:hypothetical protein